MKFLVASKRHALLPLYHRLTREGHESEAMAWRRNYEKAWSGKVTPLMRHSDGTLSTEAMQPLVEAARAGELTVVTDIERMREVFAGARFVYSQHENIGGNVPYDLMTFGGWFDGETAKALHVLVNDHAPWAGGLGPPEVLGGLTLIRLPEPGGMSAAMMGEALHAVTEQLKSASFRGLFQFGVVENATTGSFELAGLVAGWPTLQTEAFVAELGELGALMMGAEPELTKRFVTVAPMTVAPWPSTRAGELEPVEIGGLTPQQQGSVFWYDVSLDVENRRLMTAGLDGLVGVATGASDSTPRLAQARAMETASRIRLRGLQFRSDVGSAVETALATLEERWGLSVF